MQCTKCLTLLLTILLSTTVFASYTLLSNGSFTDGNRYWSEKWGGNAGHGVTSEHSLDSNGSIGWSGGTTESILDLNSTNGGLYAGDCIGFSQTISEGGSPATQCNLSVFGGSTSSNPLINWQSSRIYTNHAFSFCDYNFYGWNNGNVRLEADGGGSFTTQCYFDYFYTWRYPSIIHLNTTSTSVTYGDVITIDSNTSGFSQKINCAWQGNVSKEPTWKLLPNGSFEDQMAGWQEGDTQAAMTMLYWWNDFNTQISTDSNTLISFPTEGTSSLKIQGKYNSAQVSSFSIRPFNAKHIRADTNICFDYYVRNLSACANGIELQMIPTGSIHDSNFAGVLIPNIAYQTGTLCGVLPADKNSFYLQANKGSTGCKPIYYFDNFRISNYETISDGNNLCATQSWTDNPSCSFTVQRANGDYNLWCQVYDSVGNYSGTDYLKLTVTGGMSGSAIVQPFVPETYNDLNGMINLKAIPSDANLVVHYHWQVSPDNLVWDNLYTSNATIDDTNSNRYWATYLLHQNLSGGFYYRLDVNAEDYYNHNSISFQSNSVRVVGGTSPTELLFTGISNIDSNYTLSGNFIVLPSEETQNLIFSIENLTGSAKQYGMVIKNSDNSGNEYVIYSASESDYEAGIWNYDDSLTWTPFTLTVGATTRYLPIQKVWSVAEQLYDYNSWEGGLTALTKKYYKWVYIKPVFHYSTTNSPDWDNTLPPSTSDYNGLAMDIYSPSPYSQMTTTFLKKLPLALDSSSSPFPMEFKVTARTDTVINDMNFRTLKDYVNQLNPLTNLNYPITSNWITYAYGAQFEGYIQMKTSVTTAAIAYMQNYSFVPRGYFSKPISISQVSGAELPAYLIGEDTWKYVNEGGSVRINSEYYDPLGEIDRVEIRAYLEYVNDANLVKKWIFDAPSASSEPITIASVVNNITDLTKNAPDRDLYFSIRLVDYNSEYYEIQSTVVKLRQFPKTTADFSLNLSDIGNLQVGKSPLADVIIYTESPETLRGVKLYIHDYNHALNLDENNADFNKIYWKDVDFTCAGFVCDFRWDLSNEYIWGSEGLWLVTASALLTTEAENVKSSLTAKTKAVNVYYKSYETLRVFQTIERSDKIYNDVEQKQFVLQLRDSGTPNCLKYDLSVYLTLARCNSNVGGTDDCTDIDLNYYPQSYYCEEYSTVGTGYNYYFWRDVFREADGGYLHDDNTYQIKAHVIDLSHSHSATEVALLADKCADKDENCQKTIEILGVPFDYTDMNCFASNQLSSLNHYSFGCQKTTSAKVTTTDNNSEEKRILIKLNHPVTAPSLEAWGCFNSDQNNMYQNQLEQDISCLAFYKVGEASIDRFDFYMGNPNSDFTKRPEDRQYLKINIPYEYIALNDMTLMWQSLKKDFSSDQLDTVGEVGLHFFNRFVYNPVANNPSVHSITDLITGNTFRLNLGYDYNFDKAFDPRYLSGIIIFRLKGIHVLNMRDYVETYPDLNRINPKDFRQYMNYMARPLTIQKTDVYLQAGLTTLSPQQIESPLVINQDYTTQTLKIENQDINGMTTYSTLPTILQFYLITDLVYDHETAAIRRYVEFFITATLTQVNWITDIQSWFIGNWFWVLAVMVAALFIAMIYSKFAGGGGNSTTVVAGRQGG